MEILSSASEKSPRVCIIFL